MSTNAPTIRRPDRCAKHKDRETRPPVCMICARLTVEQDIVTRVVDAVLAAGYRITVDNEGGEPFAIERSTDRAAILAVLFEVDDERLYLCKADDAERVGEDGWIYCVYGNDGYDVISDYTTNLESVLKPVNDYADTLAS